MSTRRQRSRRGKRSAVATRDLHAGVPRTPVYGSARPIDAAARRTREVVLADLTASESDRRHLEEARPLLELVVHLDRHGYGRVLTGGPEALSAAVRIAGPCPTGWCRYPAGHAGDHEPLEAA